MELNTNSCYKNFYDSISQMKSVVTSALENRELVDDEFNTVKKFSFTWVILTITRPFYALFGRDSFRHVRVDAVARKVFTFCNLNRQYVTPSLQKELSEMIAKLDGKTNNKYSNSLSTIASDILQISKESEEFWVNLKTDLELLAAASWTGGIPEFRDATNDLDKLAVVFKALQQVTENPEVSQIRADTVRVILEKSWAYSCAISDLSSALKACKICLSYANTVETLNNHEIHSEKCTFAFSNGDRIEIPSCATNVLANRFDFLQTHGLFCTDITLPACTGERLHSVVNNCQNLVLLDLSGCSQLSDQDLKDITCCKKLQSLSLQRWNSLTHNGLQHIKNLNTLKYLDISYCPQISRVRHFWILDEQIKSGLKITSTGCEEDVQQAKEIAERVESNRNFKAKIDAARASGYMSGGGAPAYLSLFEKDAWTSGVMMRLSQRCGRMPGPIGF